MGNDLIEQDDGWNPSATTIKHGDRVIIKGILYAMVDPKIVNSGGDEEVKRDNDG